MQLEIQVTGASNPKPPGEITVDGLEIRSTGTSRQYQMQNFSVSYSFTFAYTIMPFRAGTIKIPPQESRRVVKSAHAGIDLARRRSARTVRALGSRQEQCRHRSGADWIRGDDFAEIGRLRRRNGAGASPLGLNMRAPVESLGAGMQIAGQGFTTQKMTEPRQTMETINGRSYQVFIFKTAISPRRSGKLEIGPAEINPVVRVPRRRNANPMMPRGGPFDDPFFNNFFNDPAFAPSMPQEVHLKSEAATLEVKPLPPKPPVGVFRRGRQLQP